MHDGPWCGLHDSPLVWERGGDDMPTIRGRWYCPTCQDMLMEALDPSPTPPGADSNGPRVVCEHDPVCHRRADGWPACVTSPGEPS